MTNWWIALSSFKLIVVVTYLGKRSRDGRFVLLGNSIMRKHGRGRITKAIFRKNSENFFKIWKYFRLIPGMYLGLPTFFIPTVSQW